MVRLDPDDSDTGIVELFKATGRHDVQAALEWLTDEGTWEILYEINPQFPSGLVKFTVPLHEGENEPGFVFRFRVGSFE